MDYYEMMKEFAPKDCQPTELTVEGIEENWAKHLDKKVEDLTKEEKQAAWDNYDNACWTEYDLATS